jgi:hypothetical protein
MKPARKRVQAIALGRGRDSRVVIPLAFEVAARISARPLNEFRNDPTQLANGLGELHNTLGSDGIVCGLMSDEHISATNNAFEAAALLAQPALAASLEATRRLRATYGDNIALLAVVFGPATLAHQFEVAIDIAVTAFLNVQKEYLNAGADLVLVMEGEGADISSEAWSDCMTTAANVARFHQACLLGWDIAGLSPPHRVPVSNPEATGLGIVTSAEFIAADADIVELKNWVRSVRGNEQ